MTKYLEGANPNQAQAFRAELNALLADFKTAILCQVGLTTLEEANEILYPGTTKETGDLYGTIRFDPQFRQGLSNLPETGEVYFKLELRGVSY